MHELDVKDRKLLFHLSQDARMGNAQLGKRVGLSKNAVGYRIARLRERGVITHFRCVAGLSGLGFDTFTLLLKFNEDVYERAEILSHFRDHPYADWVATLSGEWDMLAEFVCRGLAHLHDLVKEAIARFPGALATYQLFFSFDVVKVEHLAGDVFAGLGLARDDPPARVLGRGDADATDLRVLHALNEDASRTYLSVAQATGLTIDVVRYRLRGLEERGVLLKCFCEVSLAKLGYTEYLGMLRLKNLTRERIDRLSALLRADPSVTYAFFDTVGFNLVFVCAFRAAGGMDALARSLRRSYGDVIERQEYLIVKEQVKFDLLPPGLLEDARTAGTSGKR